MIVEKVKNIKAVRDVWISLQNDNEKMGPFQYYQYYDVICRHNILYRLKERSVPEIYLIKTDGGDVKMIAPLCRLLGKERGYKILGNGQAATLDFIYSGRITDEEITQCLIALKETLKGRLYLTRVKPESRLLNSPMISDPENPIKFVSVHFKDGYDEFWGRLSKSTKQNIRTAYNHLKTDNKGFEFSRRKYQDLTDIEKKAISKLYFTRLTQKYDKPNNIIYRYLYENVHHYSVAFKALDNVDYYILKIDGELSAFLAGMNNINGDYFIVPRLAIDDEFKRYSPGMILVNEVIKYMSEQTNIREFDLSRGDEKYKYVLGGEEYLACDYYVK